MRSLVAVILSLWCLPAHAYEPEMVRIPGGTFMMENKQCGTFYSPYYFPYYAKDECPRHRVRITPLEVSKYEITWDQWEACVRDNGCKTEGQQARGGDEGFGKGNQPARGRKSGGDQVVEPSSPMRGRPRRSTGSSRMARTSVRSRLIALAAWATRSDLPIPGGPHKNAGLRAVIRVRRDCEAAEGFMGVLPLAKSSGSPVRHLVSQMPLSCRTGLTSASPISFTLIVIGGSDVPESVIAARRIRIRILCM